MYKNERPIWFMRQAGRYLPEYKQTREEAGGFLKLCFNPELACEVTLQPIKRFGFSHAIIFSDILTIPFAMGHCVTIDENKGGPLVQILENPKQIYDLKFYEIEKLKTVLEAITLTRQKLPKTTKLIGFCGAPWTLCVYMLQGKSSISNEVLHILSYEDRKALNYLIDLLTKSIIDYLIKQIDAGCDTIQLFDSWANFMSPENFKEFILLPHQKIISAIKTLYPHITIIGFPRGIGNMLKNYAQETGCDYVGCDTSVSLETMRDLQKICGVQGNLDNYLLLAGGEMLEKKTVELMSLYESGDYIFNLGHGIVPQTPITHVDKVVKIVKGLSYE